MRADKVFILGAGASRPYGYPLGNELIQNIIKFIDEDKIYFPRTDIISRRSDTPFALTTFNDELPKLGKLSDLGRSDKKAIFRYTTPLIDSKKSEERFYAAPVSRTGFIGIEISLSEIKELLDLRMALVEHAPVSIDEFLSLNPVYKDAGKCMIVYTLMKCEDSSKFMLTSDTSYKVDNWYPHLLSDMLSGCAENPGKIKQANMSFVSFNYDVSLDFYIRDRLAKVEKIAELISEEPDVLQQYRVYHVYGSLYGDSEYEYGKYTDSVVQHRDKTLGNLLRFQKSMALFHNIWTINEERGRSGDEIQKLIMEARELIIIGFGFNRDNLNQLGFPDTLNGYRKLFKNKIIRYMNYAGEMTALDMEFSQIETMFNARVNEERAKAFALVCSHAEKITTAYSKDFKTALIR